MDIKEHADLNTHVYQFAQGYLETRGWFDSLDGIPRNKDGVVPWITYPAFVQLSRIVRSDFKVFEYGCGGSSLWWSGKVAEVTSVEHDGRWAAHVAEGAQANLKIVVREMDEPVDEARRAAVRPFFADPPNLPLSPKESHNRLHGLMSEEFVAYATEIMAFPKAHFDVIVIDGMARVLSTWVAISHLKPGGFILFDNSDRWQYNAAYQMLHAAGFRRIDYYGPGPVNKLEWCTSVFVRDLSVFDAAVDSATTVSDMGW